MVGGGAIAIVILLVLMTGGGGENADASGKTGSGSQNADSSQNAKSPARPARTPASGTAKAGKTPDRPAPALSHDTLDKLDDLLAEAKTFYNEGVRARNATEHQKAREAQSKAKAKLDAWEKLVEPQLRWQEEAEMEDWAQPAEYDLLTRRYPTFSKLQKMVRMGGGK